MSEWVYIDGEYFEKENAKISVFDHGLLYGDGVFEGIRAYNGRVFKLKEHVERLYDSAKVINLKIHVSKSEMEQIVLNTCAKNNIHDGYIRLVITRGVGDLGLNPYLCKVASIVCIAATIRLYDAKYYDEGLKIITVPTVRNHHEALNPRVKSLNYLNNIMAKMEAIQSGVLEALVLNNQGFVAECTGDNVFFIKNDILKTPAIACGALEGITRNTVIELAKNMGMVVEETFLTRFDVYTCDECFLTGTAAELIPVVEVDSRMIGEGQVGTYTKKLLKLFQEHTQSVGATIPQMG